LCARYGTVYEGPCERDSSTKCSVMRAPPPGMTVPFYYYQHTQVTQGGAVTGSVFVPDGIWPVEYKYLFIDFIFDGIYNLIEDKASACVTCIPPVPAFRNETFHTHMNMVDMFFGPYKNTKALYVITQSPGQNIRRIRYTGSSNRAPTAVITIEQTRVLRFEILSFQGTSSYDPDGDALTYFWNFGDGTNSTLPSPQKSYPAFGEYLVTLTVTDTLKQTSQTFVTIVVGTIPAAIMESPMKGQIFSVGQVIRLIGNATDMSGKPIPSDRIFWEVKLHHAQHFHPYMDKRSGNDLVITAPAPEELAAAGNSYLEVIMSSVDPNGITRTISREMRPRRVVVEIFSDPLGLDVLINESPITTPGAILTWVNQTIRLEAKNQSGYVFDSWNILGLQKRNYIIKAPTGTRRRITAYMKPG
jgi:PKD repeat protein